MGNIKRPVAFKLSPEMLAVLETLTQLAWEDRLEDLLSHERQDPTVQDFLFACKRWEEVGYPTEAYVCEGDPEAEWIDPARLKLLMGT